MASVVDCVYPISTCLVRFPMDKFERDVRSGSI